MCIEARLLRALERSTPFPKEAVRTLERFTGCGSVLIKPEGIEWRKALAAKSASSEVRAKMARFVTGLSPYIGRVVIGGCLWTATHRYWVSVDPESEEVFHWEEVRRNG